MGQFVDGDAARVRFRELFDQVDAAHDEMRALSSDQVGNEFRVEMAERLETQERTNRGLMYRVFGEIADPSDEVGLAPGAHAVANPDIPMPPPARTGGDTALPMRDLIRMGADGIHYLAVFDNHIERPLYLGRQARIATADQRIICYARDGGCTHPNCLEPGDHCEVHHSPDWVAGGATDADKLFFACGPDHGLVTKGHRQTIVTDTGRLAWTDGIKPPEINHAHHPDELLRGDPDPPDDLQE